MSKVCKECGVTKPNYKFTGTKNVCHLCYNEKNHDVISNINMNSRASLLKSKYDLTLAEYDRMLKDQYCRCAICEKVHTDIARKLSVDHCHTSGQVRMLLCTACNTALGLLKEDPQTVMNMLDYIKKFEYLKIKNKKEL